MKDLWGVSASRQERLKNGIAVGDMVADSPTRKRWREETMWGLSVSWTGAQD